MKYLLYCITRIREIQETPETGRPPGVGGEPVFVVAEGGLCAVTSRMGGVDLPPDPPRILAYEKVVEFFHRVSAVIPMRYGCVVEKESAITRFLEERRENHERLLGELEDCDEMGIRILPDRMDPGAMVSVPPRACVDGSAHAASRRGDASVPLQAGHAYVAALRERLAAQDRLTHEEEKSVACVCAGLTGLFIRSRIESTARGGIRLISLYFLVPRGSVPAFRIAFRRMSSRGMDGMLLSGPWPPYNFARPDRGIFRGSLAPVPRQPC